MTTYRVRLALTWSTGLAACARTTGGPASAPRPDPPPVCFQVLGNASPSDTGAPTLRIEGQRVTIRGLERQVEGGGLYGDLDVSEPRTLRLTLYDSMPGRPVDDPPPIPRYRQVIYQATIGPLAPGAYDVWVGRFDARARMVEVAHQPLRIQLEAAAATPDPPCWPRT
jgi:hypothetical protein